MRFLLFVLMLGWGLATARAATPTDADIDALLRASGMQAQLDQIPNALRTAGQQQGGLGAGLIKPLVDTLSAVFNPLELQRLMRAEVVRQLDTDTLAAAMTWFNSAEAHSILAAEQRLFEPAVMDRIAAAMESGTTPELTPARKRLLQEIDRATGATEAALDMMMNMQAAFLTAFSHLLMPDQANEFSATLASFAGTRSQYRKLVQDQLLLQQAVLMEPVTDDALQKLRDFARTDAGRKTLAALNSALSTTLRTLAERIPDTMNRVEKNRDLSTTTDGTAVSGKPEPATATIP
jgi:hypothetical protein